MIFIFVVYRVIIWHTTFIESGRSLTGFIHSSFPTLHFSEIKGQSKDGEIVSLRDQASVQNTQLSGEMKLFWPTIPSSGPINGFHNSFMTSSDSNLMMKIDQDRNLDGHNLPQAYNDFLNRTNTWLAPAPSHAHANENYVPYDQGNATHSHSFVNPDAANLTLAESSNNGCAQNRDLARCEQNNFISLEEFLIKASNDGFKLDQEAQSVHNVNTGAQVDACSTKDLPQSSNKLFDSSKSLANRDSGTTANKRIEENSSIQQPAHLSGLAPGDDISPSIQSVNTFQFANYTPSYMGVQPVYAPIPVNELSASLDHKHDLPLNQYYTAIPAIPNQVNKSAIVHLPSRIENASEAQSWSQQTGDTFDSNYALNQGHASTDISVISNFDGNIQKGFVQNPFNVFSFSHDTSCPMTDSQSQSWQSFDQADSQTITPKRVSRMGHTNYMTPIVSEKEKKKDFMRIQFARQFLAILPHLHAPKNNCTI